MTEPTSTLAPPAAARADTPAAPTPAPPARRPRRRRRLLVVALLAGALLVPAAAAVPGLLVSWAPAAVQFADGAPATAVDRFGGPDGTYVVSYEHDRSMSLTIDLSATGMVGARVTDVVLATQSRSLLVPSGSSEVREGTDGDVSVQVPLRFDNCEAYHEREAMLVHHVDVHAHALGRTVVERVPLDRPMMVRSPMLWQCPDRTIDRSDDLRGPVR